MARKKNPRVVAVGILADIKRTADALRSRWTHMASGTVYIPGTETRMAPKFPGQPVSDRNPLVPTAYSMSTTRRREPGEYPEAQRAEWVRMWAAADDMERQASELKAFALAQWQAFEGNEGYVLTRKDS